jgi:hypothetical protein
MPTKSHAVHPQRDRNMPSRSDCGCKAKMLHCLLNGMASKLVPEIMIPKDFVHLLQSNTAHQMPTVHNQTFHDN